MTCESTIMKAHRIIVLSWAGGAGCGIALFTALMEV